MQRKYAKDRLRVVSLFSSVSHARERASSGEAARREKRGRATAREEKRDSLFSCLSRLAPSVTRVCILARFVRRTKKKERLLVVYARDNKDKSIVKLNKMFTGKLTI